MTIRGRTAIVLVAVLVVSLALNFFGAGLIAAGVGFRQQLAGFDRSILQLAERFPREIRRAVAADLIARREEGFTALDELRAARREMFAAMRAEPLDRMRLERAMAAVRAKTQTLQAFGQSALAAALAAASAETRAKIAPPE
ncbi:MAG: periplasmic heavy metal sensor [Alphaproteobacteria bacterium]